MRIETSLLHPVLRDYVAALGVVAKKDAAAEPKTAFQKWCRGRSVEPKRVRPHPKSKIAFLSRAARRNLVRGAHPDWRVIWQATGGYPDLMKDFAAYVNKQAAGAPA